MNDYIQTFFLAALQGLTEFLPISSSGHLELLPRIAGWGAPGLPLVVAAHLGTLLAVLVYFRADFAAITADWLRSLGRGPATPHSRLGWSLLIATLITALAGAFAADFIERALRAPLPVALATLIFGALLGLADWRGRKTRGAEELGKLRLREAVLLGCAQALALAPGVSRAGVTISAGLALGLTREAASRFSFLLAMPAIALAGAWQLRQLLRADANPQWGELAFAALVSALIAFATIRWFLAFVRRHSLLWFALYRVLLGAVLLAVFL